MTVACFVVIGDNHGLEVKTERKIGRQLLGAPCTSSARGCPTSEHRCGCIGELLVDVKRKLVLALLIAQSDERLDAVRGIIEVEPECGDLVTGNLERELGNEAGGLPPSNGEVSRHPRAKALGDATVGKTNGNEIRRQACSIEGCTRAQAQQQNAAVNSGGADSASRNRLKQIDSCLRAIGRDKTGHVGHGDREPGGHRQTETGECFHLDAARAQ